MKTNERKQTELTHTHTQPFGAAMHASREAIIMLITQKLNSCSGKSARLLHFNEQTDARIHVVEKHTAFYGVRWMVAGCGVKVVCGRNTTATSRPSDKSVRKQGVYNDCTIIGGNCVLDRESSIERERESERELSNSARRSEDVTVTNVFHVPVTAGSLAVCVCVCVFIEGLHLMN